MNTIHAYLLYEHKHKSYRFLISYQVRAPDGRPVEYFERTALEHSNESFSYDNCSMLTHRGKLSNWREGQTLIIVFSKFVAVI